MKSLVGVAGFEPATPASRTQCSTGLSHTPTRTRLIALAFMHRKTMN
jgi:L-threonylcarbamoyladenylate synthase